MVCCVHNIPGRARFKIEALRKDETLASLIKLKVGALDFVKSVEINRKAASVVVHYCTKRGEVGRIMDHICAHCPKAATPRAPEQVARPLPHRQNRPLLKTDTDFGRAMTNAAGKAVVNTLINRLVLHALH
ncbi:HMA2 domain-containing protein [Celeribacter persicus]|jgi:hypothetical protein|uniref:Uncharacterized protein n=1 Tax=Celeribacter persicus TaxID=1651082 RepID=A0A2T5HJZ5_9RHOB|nr:hypothetical protein [Celeribacter persicus]PTQ71892.1 hypothetical protein C8N42_10771 [Celeribacter persicus]